MNMYSISVTFFYLYSKSMFVITYNNLDRNFIILDIFNDFISI